MSEIYPESCARGISDPTHVDKDGTVFADVFPFSKQAEKGGILECSIDWVDSNEVIDRLMTDLKPNTSRLKYPKGVAVCKTSHLKRLLNDSRFATIFSIKRDRLDHNQHHGNLCLAAQTLRGKVVMLSNAIAMEALFIPNTH